MNKLKELIEQLCPDGVEYKTIGEIGQISRGGNFQKKDFVEAGIPCIHYGQIYTRYGLFADKTFTYISESIAQKQKFAQKNDIVMAVTSENIEDVCKCVAWLGEEPVAVSGHSAIIHHSLNPKFFVYFLHSSDFFRQKKKLAHGTKVIEVTPDKLADIKVPVPPMEIQNEIVRILDRFTELTTELTGELTAELTARKKQYDYYGDILFSSDIPKESWKRVEEVIISLKTGLNPRQNFKLNTGGNKPYITGKDIYNNSINVSERTDLINDKDIELINRRACLEDGDVLFASTGTGTVGRMAVIEEYNHDWAVSETMFCLKPKKDMITPYYLMYALYTQSAKNQFEPKISKGSVPHLKVKDLLDVKIPIPTLDEQNRIIMLMRRFDKICNDISDDIPAEIKARQKQYEFYKDKLLSFKEIGA